MSSHKYASLGGLEDWIADHARQLPFTLHMYGRTVIAAR